MTEVFLLGTFHFSHSKKEIFTNEARHELGILNQKLMGFSPDVVAIEYPYHQQANVDAGYEKFSLADLSDFEKMKTINLGKIKTFGRKGIQRYKNEVVQVGFRLAKSLDLEKVYAIDDDSFYAHVPVIGRRIFIGRAIRHVRNMLAWPNNLPKDIKAAYDVHMKHLNEEKVGILEQLDYMNTDEWSYHNHVIYFERNKLGAETAFAGSMNFGSWYTRNLRIFAHIQELCQHYNRVFVLIGAGHLHLLREFVNVDSDMRLVSLSDINKAGGEQNG